MSVDHNTAIQKVLFKTRSWLRVQSRGNSGAVRKSGVTDDYDVKAAVTKGGHIRVEIYALCGNEIHELCATWDGLRHVTVNATHRRRGRAGQFNPAITMGEREALYTLRTALKRVFPGWQSHRAPMPNRKMHEVRTPSLRPVNERPLVTLKRQIVNDLRSAGFAVEGNQ